MYSNSLQHTNSKSGETIEVYGVDRVYSPMT